MGRIADNQHPLAEANGNETLMHIIAVPFMGQIAIN